MTSPAMNRDHNVQRIRERSSPWDLVVIGGGATGVGVALDAASRKLDVLMLEQSDFGKATSSRSTKLVHGGVRYLRQGNITLVRDALRERTLLRRNAPHLVTDLPFLIPCDSLWQRFFYGVGLKMYDFLAVRNSFGKSHGVSMDGAKELIPVLKREGLRGGVVYHDGQFDDARLLVNMVRTAHDHGACVVNYMAASKLIKDEQGQIAGVVAVDHESGSEIQLDARCVINAAGPFCDEVRALDDAGEASMLAHSQGIHLVLPRSFYPGDTAMIVPKTSDGRVIFIIPWHHHVLVGTTDTPIPKATLEPAPQKGEIEFLLETSARYLETPPTIQDALSVFTGIRPLVKGDKSARTASLSRDHVIRVSPSGLITIAGGKWTTVRKMAEDCVDRAIREAGLPAVQCCTEELRIHGAAEPQPSRPRSFYGTDLELIEQLESEHPELAQSLDDTLELNKSDVVWAVRNEMARTVEDVLARRTRGLFLNSHACLAIAPEVANLMARELGKDHDWCAAQVDSFQAVAEVFTP